MARIDREPVRYPPDPLREAIDSHCGGILRRGASLFVKPKHVPSGPAASDRALVPIDPASEPFRQEPGYGFPRRTRRRSPRVAPSMKKNRQELLRHMGRFRPWNSQPPPNKKRRTTVDDGRLGRPRAGSGHRGRGGL